MIKFFLLKLLKKALFELSKQERTRTKNKYNRINPFYEDIIDWKERGEFIAGNGSNVTIYNSTTVVGDVKIGINTWVGPFCSLDGTGGLEIGSHCSIAVGSHIFSHDTVKWALSNGMEKYAYEKTVIGDKCFIGANSIITKGVTIGNECLITANSVVSKNFKNNSIIAGIPAKKIGEVIVNKNGKIDYKYFKDINSEE